MKIYLEVLVLFIIIFIIVAWKIWDSLSKMILTKKYKPENDKSRKGGIANTESGRAKPISNLKIEDNGGSDESKGRELFSSTDVSPIREDSNSSRRNSKGVSRFFRRRRK